MADNKLNTDKIKEMLKTPPALGVEIEHAVSDMVNQITKEQDKYIQECLVRCKVDPDALLKTAQKNRELMDTLEDINRRIENEELIEVTWNKDEQFEYITGLLIDFDEMGFAPTTLCPDPEGYAIEWRKKLTNALQCCRKQSEWISVDERLPESGMHCLLCCDVKRYDGTHRQYVCDGYYAERFKEECYSADDECVTEYNEETDEYYLHEGWYENINNWDDYSSIGIADTVTHWMPLPEAPKMIRK